MDLSTTAARPPDERERRRGDRRTAARARAGLERRGADDARLLALAGRGSQASWELLVHRHAAAVWTACRAVTATPQAAADASQLVWLRLAEQLAERVDDGPAAPLRPWLLAQARRTAARSVRTTR